MTAVLGFISGVYLWGALLIAWPYFWFKRTNRSMSPFERRLRAMILGFGWPYFVYRHFAGRSAAAAAEDERQAAADRIIGGSGGPAQRIPAPADPAQQVAPPTATGSPSSRISNPFDNV
ncbi:hypothetical protein DQ239_18600 [Blastococcus sp. TF02-09]|uniref:hypothetical protein n=1 Tax=Blastococcus sp. TF02-09 TaxID=2250576 RepID=UPI000DEB5565|nr:hypothetical protein [Blastococcus sp. TF02-9]RBY74804.1 hypothetical protein DQ239_18600 [Blastococcus sp. TF02-9]